MFWVATALLEFDLKVIYAASGWVSHLRVSLSVF